MENDQEIHKIGSQFSTLNVNAVEFVPSFVSAAKEIEKTIEEPPPTMQSRPIETQENNGNGMYGEKCKNVLITQ